MFKEFKEFAMRGNVMDLAIAVVIGGAFGKIVTSFVNDILMPPIGLLLGGLKFDNYFIVLRGGSFATLEDAQAAGAITWNYGSFLTTVVDFLIIAFAIFLVVQQLNRLQRQEEAPAPEPTTKACPHCFTDIPIKATRCPNCTSQLA